MLVLESELPYQVYYCPQCEFTIKNAEWWRRSNKKTKEP